MVLVVHNPMHRHEAIPFVVRIDKFSLRARRGYYESQVFEHKQSDTTWSLVLYPNIGDDYSDSIDIWLKRNESDSRDLFVELKLSVVDGYFGYNISEEKKFSFTQSSATQKALSTNDLKSEINKLRFLPDDTLTLRGEMVVYEETQISLENSQRRSHSAQLALARWIFWKLLVYSAIMLIAVAGVYLAATAIVCVFKYIIVPFLIYVCLPFMLLVLGVVAVFFHLKKKAEKSLTRPLASELNGYSRRELVPVIIYGIHGQSKNYLSNANNCQSQKALIFGRSGKNVKYLLDSGYAYNCQNPKALIFGRSRKNEKYLLDSRNAYNQW